MTFRTKPSKLVLEETDAVCLEALGAILPIAGALCRETAEEGDYLPNIRYLQCPDAERPVVFEIKRVKVDERF